MPRPELLKELKIREKELTEELEAVQKILYSNTISSSDVPKTGQIPSNSTSFGTPKGSMGWEVYAKFMLKEVGGEAKARKVTEVAIRANPGLDEKTVRNAIRSKLSKLALKKEIQAIPGKVPSEGSVYKV